MVLQSPHLLKDRNPQIQSWRDLFFFFLFIYLFIYLFIFLVTLLRIGLFTCSDGQEVVLESPHLLKESNPQMQCSSDLFSFSLFIDLFI